MYAVCPNCGVCSLDHSKCSRCKKIFYETDNIKQTPVTMGSDTKPTPAVTTTKQVAVMPTLMQTEKQKKEMEMVQKRHQINAELMK